MSHPGRVPRAGLASFLTHLCAALVHRDAFFGRNFGAVFEHAKTLITKERYTAMSHPRRVPRAGLSALKGNISCSALKGVLGIETLSPCLSRSTRRTSTTQSPPRWSRAWRELVTQLVRHFRFLEAFGTSQDACSILFAAYLHCSWRIFEH